MTEVYLYLREGACSLTEDETEEYAVRHGLHIAGRLTDSAFGYRAYRFLQDLIKHGVCRSVLLPSFDVLGEDEYVRYENKLFLERNAELVFCVNKPERYSPLFDPRMRTLTAVRRSFGEASEWDKAYGMVLPKKDTRLVFSRKPPFGYAVKDGKIYADEQDSAVVRAIFDAFNRGLAFRDICAEANSMPSSRKGAIANMTAKTILRNEHYLGRYSKKGYSLPTIVDRRAWLLAAERFERDYRREPEPEPFFAEMIKGKQLRYIRAGETPPDRFSGFGAIVDSDELERAVYDLTRQMASEENAEAFIERYVLLAKEKLSSDAPRIQSEYEAFNEHFRRRLREYVEAGLPETEQAELNEMADRRVMLSMRVRRVMSDLDLFSMSREEIEAFFARARRIDALSVEERMLILSAFFLGFRIKEGNVFAFYIDPANGRKVRKKLPVKIYC